MSRENFTNEADDLQNTDEDPREGFSDALSATGF